MRYALEALVRNEFEDKKMVAGVPNPVEFLNFNIGIPVCLIVLSGMTVVLRLMSLLFLKLLAGRF